MTEFTYEFYEKILTELMKNDYEFKNFSNVNLNSKNVIIRHDIDLSLESALSIAKIENKLSISSTFFFLISTNFYNLFSKTSSSIIKEIASLGHNVGLHFDETKYLINNENELVTYISEERKLLGKIIGNEINFVSMHRPSKWILQNDVEIPGMINTYSKRFLSDYKYVSDSRMLWRENIIDIINSNKFEKLHILTHPFWYADQQERAKEKFQKFLENNKKFIFTELSRNITNLSEFIQESDLEQ